MIRLYLYGGILVALLLGFWWYSAHERNIGKAEIEQSDLAAKAVLDAQVKADEQIAQLAANKAAKERQDVQNQLDQYMRDHPIGVVRLCPANPGRAGLPQAPGAGAGHADSSSGSAVVPEVPGRDVSGDLHTLVRAAATLDGLYRACRQQMTP